MGTTERKRGERESRKRGKGFKKVKVSQKE